MGNFLKASKNNFPRLSQQWKCAGTVAIYFFKRLDERSFLVSRALGQYLLELSKLAVHSLTHFIQGQCRNCLVKSTLVFLFCIVHGFFMKADVIKGKGSHLLSSLTCLWIYTINIHCYCMYCYLLLDLYFFTQSFSCLHRIGILQFPCMTCIRYRPFFKQDLSTKISASEGKIIRTRVFNSLGFLLVSMFQEKKINCQKNKPCISN